MKITLELELEGTESVRDAVMRTVASKLTAAELINALVQVSATPMEDIAGALAKLHKVLVRSPDFVHFDFRCDPPKVITEFIPRERQHFG